MAILPNRNVLDGTKSPATTTSEMKTALGTLRDFLAELFGTDGSDTAAARLALGAATAGPLGSSGITGASPRATRIDVASVAGTVNLTTSAPNTDDIRITGALVITAFTVASDRVIRVTAGGAFTLTNNSNIVTQTGANIVCAAGDTFMLRATAANTVEVLNYSQAGGFVSLSGNQTIAGTKTFSSMPVLPQQGCVRLNTANGYGSTNTMIRRFTNVATNQGSDITYTDSATLGGSFTINTNGVYSICYNDQANASGRQLGITINTATPTTAILSCSVSEILSMTITSGANNPSACSCTVPLTVGAVIRAHTDAFAQGTSTAGVQFTITKVS